MQIPAFGAGTCWNCGYKNWIWAWRSTFVMNDRRSTNCVNCRTVISFMENIILPSCQIFFTFSFVRERVICIKSITRPKYSIVFTGSMTDSFKFITNLKCESSKVIVSLTTRLFFIDWDINNMPSKFKFLIIRQCESDILTFKRLQKIWGAESRQNYRHRNL